jgi:hypothetical protein
MSFDNEAWRHLRAQLLNNAARFVGVKLKSVLSGRLGRETLLQLASAWGCMHKNYTPRRHNKQNKAREK